MIGDVFCPQCNSASVRHIPEVTKYLCLRCSTLFAGSQDGTPKQLKVFLSYGHDSFAEDALAIKADLEARGHVVWFDVERIQAGSDYEIRIEKGLKDCDAVVVVMTPHSVRRESAEDRSRGAGFCLNEIAKALYFQKRIIPAYLVYVEDGPPVSISRLDYVDMRDCVHFREFPEKYRTRFARLVEALEYGRFDLEGSQSRLLKLLSPLTFEAEMGKHLAAFTGRKWVTARLDAWLTGEPDSRVFWLLGGPGFGKSAIACHWCHTRADVIAYHLCIHGHSDKADPKRIILSLAAQIAMHLPEFHRRLAALPLEDLEKKNARAAFDDLLVAPLKGDFPAPAGDRLIIIDALDEASRGSENELADFIAESWGQLPRWLRLVVTSRPEAAVMERLRIYRPLPLVPNSEENLADIRDFLTRELAGLESDFTAAAIDKIVAKSEGMFLYAKVILEEIRARHLTVVGLDELPDGLAGYYARWFAREFPDSDLYRRDFQRLVSTIIAQRAPLPQEVLAPATGLTIHDLRQRLLKLGTLFPGREDRELQPPTMVITPLHKSLRDWLTELDVHTRFPRAGRFAADVELGERLLADQGWEVFRAGGLLGNPYYSRALAGHLAAAQDPGRLVSLLLDPTLLARLWFGDHRCDWLHHMSALRKTVDLPERIREWLADRLASPDDRKVVAGQAARLSRLLQEMGAFHEAEHLALTAIQTWEAEGAIDSPEMVQSLLSLGAIHRLRDEFKEAGRCYDRSLEIAKSAYDPDSLEMADVLYQLCIFHKERRDYRKSWECLEECLRIRSAAVPPDYAGMADCINDRAVLYSAEGRPADCLAIYREALAMYARAHPGGHPEMSTTLNNVARELEKSGRTDEAIDTYRRSLAMAERFLWPHHPKCQSARADLVNVLDNSGRHEEALVLMRQQALQVEALRGLDHDDTVDARLHLCRTIGRVLRFAEDVSREELRREARDQFRTIGRARPGTVGLTLLLHDEFQRISEPELANAALEAAVRAARGEAAIGIRDPAHQAAAACCAQVVDLVTQGTLTTATAEKIERAWQDVVPLVADYGDSLALVRRHVVYFTTWAAKNALERLRDSAPVHIAFALVNRLGADSPDTLDHLESLAAMLHNERFFDDSAELFAAVLERSDRLLGPDHVQSLGYASELADLCTHRRRFDESERLVRRVFERRRQLVGDRDLSTIAALGELIALLLVQGTDDEAQALFDRFVESAAADSDGSDFVRLAGALNGQAIAFKNELGAYEAARRCYELALRLTPHDGQFHANLALLLWSCLGRTAEAEEHFARSVALNPGDATLVSNYGLFLTHEKRDLAAAEACFERAMVLDRTDRAVSGNYASLAVIQEDLTKAWRLAGRSMMLCAPRPDRIMVRPLFCAAAVLLLKGGDPAIPLGQLRQLFDLGIDHVAWIATGLLDELDRKLAPDWSLLMRAILDAAGDSSRLATLETMPLWRAIAPVPLNTAWVDAAAPGA